ncbi:MAG TPA: phosphatidylglycerol lysyltransferase domain-containing protein [Acidimicrobiales bacterium]|nr:phosphatidylglycerol lysyltransferase domain-containing protein [Acidimicrobiales bacterium]
MTTTRPSSVQVGPEGHTTGGPAGDFSPEPGATRVDVGVGRRVMVVSDLLLTPQATASTLATTRQLARALDTWDGPGVLIVAGNLFDLTGCAAPLAEAEQALRAHPELGGALTRFLDVDERRVIRQTGAHEPGYADDPDAMAHLAARGVEQCGPVDLHLRTASGVRVVRVEPGEHAYAVGCSGPETEFDPAADAKPGIVGPTPAGRAWRSLAAQSTDDAPWLIGLHRLSDPSALSRFVVSRTLYRRLGRYAWWLLVPFVVAALLRVAVTPWVLGRLGSSFTARAIRHAHQADWGDQLVVATSVALVVLGVLALVLGLLSRRMWSILGGGALDEVRSEAAANDTARDAGRRLVGRGYAGLITAATFQSELTHLGLGFYANVGATAEVVEEHRGRLGLPPVFLHNQRVSWVELETGAELHVRMLLAQNDLRSPNILERAVTRGRSTGSLHPSLVASYPVGASWPPPPDLSQAHRRPRRVRRWTAAAILVAGVVDLLDAVTPPLRGRLHVVMEILPLGASVAAGTLIAMAGLALLAVGRGILRGQRRAWRVAVILLAGTIVLHLVAGADVEESAVALAVLVLLIVNRRDFQAASDRSSMRSALVALGVGALGITLVTAVSIELFTRLGHHATRIPWWTALWAVSERLVGIRTIALPHRADRFISPALLAIGLSLVALTLFLLTRPVVDRRLTSGRAAEYRARDIVRRHGTSTLDYFALRSDKQWFFHRDSLVAYAVYGGVCLISPDPIGPLNEREQAWGAFRRFADSHGWVTSVMGAGEDWLSVYRDSGMHNIYLGDEAVVRVQQFNLAGGEKKGLRQAFNRIGKYGYTVSFHDPSHLDASLSEELTALMSLSRQGEHERGFSMMLGRVFDPRDTGLLLTVVRGPDGEAAAMCQFVPAPGIGGYSLDLMRRDPGEHPNGLLDFALCSTIEHLRAGGHQGLSLNFATLRSTLSGDKGDGTVQRAERWFLKRLSNFAQIESLWRFNAKYDPEWLPRYVVIDTAEHLVPVLMAILRAESLWEIPVFGKLLAAGAEKRMVAAQQETDEFIASLGHWDQLGDPVATGNGEAAATAASTGAGDSTGSARQATPDGALPAGRSAR